MSTTKDELHKTSRPVIQSCVFAVLTTALLSHFPVKFTNKTDVEISCVLHCLVAVFTSETAEINTTGFFCFVYMKGYLIQYNVRPTLYGLNYSLVSILRVPLVRDPYRPIRCLRNICFLNKREYLISLPFSLIPHVM